MKSKGISFFLLFLFLFAAANSYSQPPADKGGIIPANEKAELQRLAKSFVNTFRETRDLKPLVNEFFVPNFLSYQKQERLPMKSGQVTPRLSEEELLRSYVAAIDLQYILFLPILTKSMDAENTEQNPFSMILPKSIADRLLVMNQGKKSDAEKTIDHKTFVKDLSEAEQIATQARAYLQEKDYENTPVYREQFDQLAKSDFAGYIVSTQDGDSDLKLPARTKIYSVTTPLFLVLRFMKVGGVYKILDVQIYDD